MGWVGDILRRASPINSVEHRCILPSIRLKPWTCTVCRVTWTPISDGAWQTDQEHGRIVGFTMRYPDGTEETFR